MNLVTTKFLTNVLERVSRGLSTLAQYLNGWNIQIQVNPTQITDKMKHIVVDHVPRGSMLYLQLVGFS